MSVVPTNPGAMQPYGYLRLCSALTGQTLVALNCLLKAAEVSPSLSANNTAAPVPAATTTTPPMPLPPPLSERREPQPTPPATQTTKPPPPSSAPPQSQQPDTSKDRLAETEKALAEANRKLNEETALRQRLEQELQKKSMQANAERKEAEEQMQSDDKRRREEVEAARDLAQRFHALDLEMTAAAAKLDQALERECALQDQLDHAREELNSSRATAKRAVQMEVENAGLSSKLEQALSRERDAMQRIETLNEELTAGRAAMKRCAQLEAELASMSIKLEREIIAQAREMENAKLQADRELQLEKDFTEQYTQLREQLNGSFQENQQHAKRIAELEADLARTNQLLENEKLFSFQLDEKVKSEKNLREAAEARCMEAVAAAEQTEARASALHSHLGELSAQNISVEVTAKRLYEAEEQSKILQARFWDIQAVVALERAEMEKEKAELELREKDRQQVLEQVARERVFLQQQREAVAQERAEFQLEKRALDALREQLNEQQADVDRRRADMTVEFAKERGQALMYLGEATREREEARLELATIERMKQEFEDARLLLESQKREFSVQAEIVRLRNQVNARAEQAQVEREWQEKMEELARTKAERDEQRTAIETLRLQNRELDSSNTITSEKLKRTLAAKEELQKQQEDLMKSLSETRLVLQQRTESMTLVTSTASNKARHSSRVSTLSRRLSVPDEDDFNRPTSPPVDRKPSALIADPPMPLPLPTTTTTTTQKPAAAAISATATARSTVQIAPLEETNLGPRSIAFSDLVELAVILHSVTDIPGAGPGPTTRSDSPTKYAAPSPLTASNVLVPASLNDPRRRASPPPPVFLALRIGDRVVHVIPQPHYADPFSPIFNATITFQVDPAYCELHLSLHEHKPPMLGPQYFIHSQSDTMTPPPIGMGLLLLDHAFANVEHQQVNETQDEVAIADIAVPLVAYDSLEWMLQNRSAGTVHLSLVGMRYSAAKLRSPSVATQVIADQIGSPAAPITQRNLSDWEEFRRVPITLGSIVHFKNVFERADTDKCGFLNLASLRKWAERVDPERFRKVSNAQLQHMMDKIDITRRGLISFWEFFAVQTYLAMNLQRFPLPDWVAFISTTMDARHDVSWVRPAGGGSLPPLRADGGGGGVTSVAVGSGYRAAAKAQTTALPTLARSAR